MTHEPYTITDNLDELLAVLPSGLQHAIAPEDRARLVEIVLDLGRKPEARFVDRYEYLRDEPITGEELDYVESRLGAFGDDNRAGIPATLHRISAIRNRRGHIVGLTLRVGRAVMGIVDILRDLIASGESLLLLGRPGLGKTTLLREMARVMADEEGKRVVIVDTSNEIAGDGDVPHPAIGRARRMQVPKVSQQHDVMIEAVENHMPEVIVIDEIGRLEESMAARTIAERGVQLIATVHGNTLDNLLANPTMSDLIGGIQAVTLSDEEARRRGTQKTVLERKSPPTFSVVVEMIERDRITVRRPVADVVDGILRGHPLPSEIRYRDDEGNIQMEQSYPEMPAGHSAQEFEMRNESRPNEHRPHDRRGGERRSEGRGNRSNQERPSSARGRAAAAGYTAGGRLTGDWMGRDTNFGDGSGRHVSEGHHPKAAGALAGERITEEKETESDTQAFGTRSRHSERFATSAPLRTANTEQKTSTLNNDSLNSDIEDEDDDWDSEEIEGDDDWSANASGVWSDAPFDAAQVHRLYPFGISRSRLARAVKHLGLSLELARTWQDADAVMILAGRGGLSTQSSLLREARELHLPIIGAKGNTYAQILSRLNDIFGNLGRSDQEIASPRELAVIEARNAVQRVLAEAEPVELRPQGKTLRRIQHQLAERYHLRSFSVGREPNRRVRFLPTIRQ